MEFIVFLVIVVVVIYFIMRSVGKKRDEEAAEKMERWKAERIATVKEEFDGALSSPYYGSNEAPQHVRQIKGLLDDAVEEMVYWEAYVIQFPGFSFSRKNEDTWTEAVQMLGAIYYEVISEPEGWEALLERAKGISSNANSNIKRLGQV